MVNIVVEHITDNRTFLWGEPQLQELPGTRKGPPTTSPPGRPTGPVWGRTQGAPSSVLQHVQASLTIF